MRKQLIAGAQAVAGATMLAFSVLGEITKEPYSILAIMVGTTLLVGGCRDLWALRPRQPAKSPDPGCPGRKD